MNFIKSLVKSGDSSNSDADTDTDVELLVAEGGFYNQLFSRTYKNTPIHNMEGWYYAKAVKVYDGDTFTAAFQYKGEFIRKNTRMLGYDSQEIRGGTARTREQAQACKNALRGIIFNNILIMHVTGLDKYGRMLVHVYIPRKEPHEIPPEAVDENDPEGYKMHHPLLNVNDWMLQNTSSVPYGE